MDKISERIAKCIKNSAITKTEFAKRINISQSFVSEMCSGSKRPSDRTISDICREFHVNETWLRTGEGAQYLSSSEQLGAMLGSIIHGEPDFKQWLISVLLRMSPEEWALLEKKAWELVAEMENSKKETGPEGPADE